MGEDLAQEALGITKYAPLFLLFNGAWLMDNRQMFENNWNYKMTSVQFMRSGHYLEFAVTSGAPMIFIALIAFTMHIFLEVLPN